ncbi:unnamed protein product, partial [Staurois parvus]
PIYTIFAKSIRTPLQIIVFRCSNHLHGPQVYKIKHLGMQTASTNMCERMDHPQELSEYNCGTVIGCHLCNKSICEIYLLLTIPQSTVSGIYNKVEATGNNSNHEVVGRNMTLVSAC